DLRTQFTVALAASRAALAATPDQLAVLRKAGVVDAGAQGFVHLLEGIDDFMRRGRRAVLEASDDVSGEHGVVVAGGFADVDMGHRWCSECVLSGADLDRSAVREALARIDGSSLVLAGTREKLRVHMHVDDPERLFATLSAFGEVRARKADDMRAQQRSAQARGGVAIVVDSAADLPAEAFERLPIHLVPVRVTVGARDYLDKVSLSAQGFHAMLRSADVPVRTSQPPPGDFRRLFEFLLSHHHEVVYVGLSRALSGTLQAGESAAAALVARVRVVDTGNVSGGEGLLAMLAAERALAGADAGEIVAAVERARARTATFAFVRDLSSAVRGGRVPRWALPITRWLRLVPFVRIGGDDGRLHVRGVMVGHAGLAERFAARVLATLDPSQRWRAQVMHCDNRDEAERVRAALLARRPDIECTDVLDAGSAIAAHAGIGAVALSVMPRLDVA
ncbi:MAG TPA: DegV family protein, partial [Dokdonella sp.]|nr:DegV family protein [Dokdonella sp.]